MIDHMLIFINLKREPARRSQANKIKGLSLGGFNQALIHHQHHGNLNGTGRAQKSTECDLLAPGDGRRGSNRHYCKDGAGLSRSTLTLPGVPQVPDGTP